MVIPHEQGLDEIHPVTNKKCHTYDIVTLQNAVTTPT